MLPVEVIKKLFNIIAAYKKFGLLHNIMKIAQLYVHRLSCLMCPIMWHLISFVPHFLHVHIVQLA